MDHRGSQEPLLGNARSRHKCTMASSKDDVTVDRTVLAPDQEFSHGDDDDIVPRRTKEKWWHRDT